MIGATNAPTEEVQFLHEEKSDKSRIGANQQRGTESVRRSGFAERGWRRCKRKEIESESRAEDFVV